MIKLFKSYAKIDTANTTLLLASGLNKVFKVYYGPKLKDDESTPETDLNLFKLDCFEEDYFINDNIESYAVSFNKNVGTMFKASADALETQYGRFRKLTPRECLRLMGFDDNFNIVVSDTELYKQTGNSIIVDVLMALLKQIDITKYAE